MELIFLRHGEPAWAVDGMSQPDPHLTERGHVQARLAAERLANDPLGIDEIIVSSAVRAVETAQPLERACGLTATIEPDLVEMKMPRWDGLLERDVQRIFAEARHRTPEEWWDGLPGGESFRDFHSRITGAVRRILAERGVLPDPSGGHMWHAPQEDRRVVLVCHGGTNSVAIGHLLGVDPTPWEWERFILGHCSIARVKAVDLAGGQVFSLRALNDREHLPAEVRTR
jgi:probable phosphoglycerate mutase